MAVNKYLYFTGKIINSKQHLADAAYINLIYFFLNWESKLFLYILGLKIKLL